MELREISFKDFIRPKEDPSSNYAFNPRPNELYSRTFDTNKIGYNPGKNTITYSDWDYHKKKRKTLSYEGSEPFQGSYEGGGGSSYSSSAPSFSSGNYSAAA